MALKRLAGMSGLAMLNATAHEDLELCQSGNSELRSYMSKLVTEAKDVRRLGVVVEDMCQNMTKSNMCVLMLKPGAVSASSPAHDASHQALDDEGDAPELFCPAGNMSDGWDHPEVMARAGTVVSSRTTLDEVAASPSSRDEYSGKLPGSTFRYYVPVRTHPLDLAHMCACTHTHAYTHAHPSKRYVLYLIGMSLCAAPYL